MRGLWLFLSAPLMGIGFGLCQAEPPEQVSAEETAAIHRLLDSFHEAGLFSGAALVAKGGRVLVQTAFGKANLDWNIDNDVATKFALASLTKPFTATAVAMLAEGGKLDLQAPVSRCLPELHAPWAKRVRVVQLLRHESGLPRDWREYSGPRDETSFSAEEILELIEDMSLDFQPGEGYGYSNTGYFLLAQIIERATGVSYEETLGRLIFEPLGMENTAIGRFGAPLTKRATGYKTELPDRPVAGSAGVRTVDYGAGGLYATVADLYKFDRALYGTKLLSEKAKARMFKPGDHNYGQGWEIHEAPWLEGGKPLRLIMHTGADGSGFTSVMIRLPDIDATVILLTNRDTAGRRHAATLPLGIVRILTGQSVDEAPPTPVARDFCRTLFRDGVQTALRKHQELPREAFPKRWVGPRHATGAPDAEPGESYRAWASRTADNQREWLSLDYSKPVAAKTLEVFENFNPGAVDGARLRLAGGGSRDLAWKGAKRTKNKTGVTVLTVPIAEPSQVIGVTLSLDSPAVSGWNQIDAVGLRDAEGVVHWATDAKASSTAAETAPVDLFATPQRADLALWARRYAALGYADEARRLEAFIRAAWPEPSAAR